MFSTCSWDAVVSASSYHYKVTNVDTGEIVKEDLNFKATTTKILFNSEPGVTYKCEVTANNMCGSGPSGQASGVCSKLTPTPTPTITVTPTLTPTSSPTSTITVTPTITPTSSPTSTPTIAPVANVETPTPTLAATGTTTTLTIGTIAGTALVIFGAILLFVL